MGTDNKTKRYQELELPNKMINSGDEEAKKEGEEIFAETYRRERFKLRDNASVISKSLVAHHVIPVSFFKHPFVLRAIGAGWQGNDDLNAVVLPNTNALRGEFPQHRGGI